MNLKIRAIFDVTNFKIEDTKQNKTLFSRTIQIDTEHGIIRMDLFSKNKNCLGDKK